MFFGNEYFFTALRDDIQEINPVKSLHLLCTNTNSAHNRNMRSTPESAYSRYNPPRLSNPGIVSCSVNAEALGITVVRRMTVSFLRVKHCLVENKTAMSNTTIKNYGEG
jgi:hypothetical protein